MASAAENLERLLASGKDGPLLRFGLGNAYAQARDWSAAIPHLRCAVGLDPLYSAAWKLLGKSLAATGDVDGARNAYERGIAAAEQKGDKQALKEMQLFLRRLAKPPPPA